MTKETLLVIAIILLPIVALTFKAVFWVSALLKLWGII